MSLSDDELSVLSLGPNFALTPVINDTLLDSVRVEMASCAYKLRWSQRRENVQSCITNTQHIRQRGAPINRPFAAPPPNNNPETEDDLKNLSRFILQLIQSSKIKYNLSHDQAVGLKSLLLNKEKYHFSVSDKGGEFVVMDKEQQRLLTEQHISSSTGVYRYVPPFRTYNGESRDIATPTEILFNRQIKMKTEMLETRCNDLWKKISERRNLSSDFVKLFVSHHSQLPTLYVLVKTHKFNVNEICTNRDIQAKCKVRAIVSCCSSPTEKLAWLCTEILSPLLNLVPSHLNNIYDHLSTLNSLTSQELAGRKFCSADISSLYTNINVYQSIDDVIEFAAVNLETLDLLGLQLVDVHEMLESVLGNAFFTYQGKLYLQLTGLFMGCKPSPIVAIIRVYIFGRRSIYTDINFLSKPYGRYIDDGYGLVTSLEEVQVMFDLIAAEDPDGLLQWEVDFPESNNNFVHFLGTQVRVSIEGNLEYKFYRKLQKKNITLYYKSHHPLKTKIEDIKNFYRAAEMSSSSPEYAEESFQVLDLLLRCNGYTNPRQVQSTRMTGLGMPKNTSNVMLKLPYISEYVSKEILRFIKKRKLPISVVFTPGKKLKDLLCSSRPYDKARCTIRNCRICANLENNVTCTVKYPMIYSFGYPLCELSQRTI